MLESKGGQRLGEGLAKVGWSEDLCNKLWFPKFVADATISQIGQANIKRSDIEIYWTEGKGRTRSGSGLKKTKGVGSFHCFFPLSLVLHKPRFPFRYATKKFFIFLELILFIHFHLCEVRESLSNVFEAEVSTTFLFLITSANHTRFELPQPT